MSQRRGASDEAAPLMNHIRSFSGGGAGAGAELELKNLGGAMREVELSIDDDGASSGAYPLKKPARRVDLDRMMVLLTYCLFVFHFHRFFDHTHYPIYLGPGKESAVSFHAEAISVGLISWHLPAFFLLAGMSASAFIDSKVMRGAGIRSIVYAVFKERTLRLLVPAISTFFLIIVPEHYIMYEYRTPTAAPFWEWYRYFLEHNFNLARAWFLLSLYAFSLLLMPFFLMYKFKLNDDVIQQSHHYLMWGLLLTCTFMAHVLAGWVFSTNVLFTYGGVLVAAYVLRHWKVRDDWTKGVVATALIAWVFMLNLAMYTIPENLTKPASATFVSQTPLHHIVLLLVYFSAFYTVGFVVNQFEDGIAAVLRHYAGVLWAMAPVLFCIIGLIFPRVDMNSGFYYAIAHLPCYNERSYRFFLTIYVWCAMFLIYWLVTKGWNGTETSTLLRWLRRSSMWVFELHFMPQVYVLALVRHTGMSWYSMYGLICVVSLVFTLGSFWIVDSNRVTRFIFGLK